MSSVLRRARLAIGAPFRLHGRDPATGLDCVGLVAWAAEVDAPTGYRLRGGVPDRVAAALDVCAQRIADPLPGDVALFAVGAGQLHLGVLSGAGLIHADASLRRVALRPGPLPWPTLGVWRF